MSGYRRAPQAAEGVATIVGAAGATVDMSTYGLVDGKRGDRERAATRNYFSMSSSFFCVCSVSDLRLRNCEWWLHHNLLR